MEPAEELDPVQFTVALVQPERSSRSASAVEGGDDPLWDHCPSRKEWCAVRELLGGWTVCGQVTNQLGLPVPGATVSAFDADIVQDELVGTDTTDATGRYRIDYRTRDFETTPSPWPPIELEHGPDLYFRVERGGDSLLQESRPDGRQAGRENADHCERIDLEVSGGIFPPTPTLWTGLGSTFDVPSSPTDLNDVTPDGYLDAGGGTNPDNYALTGNVDLTGNISEEDFIDRTAPASRDSVEYRFLVFDRTARNDRPTPPVLQNPANGRPVAGSLVHRVEIGTLYYHRSGGAQESVDVFLDSSHVDSSTGWVNVRDVVDDALSGASGGPADLTDALTNYRPVWWDDADPLLGLNTDAVTTEPDLPDSTAAAGDPVSSGAIPTESVAIRFETRRSATGTSGRGSGKTLNSVAVNNNSTFREMDVEDSAGNAVGCDEQFGTLTVEFTAYHPHLRDVDIQIRHNESSCTHISPSGTGSPVLDGNTAPGTESANGSFAIPSSELGRDCAYVVRFRTRRRLHDGESAVSHDGWLQELFYYRT